MQGFFDHYESEGYFDEMFSSDGSVRLHYQRLLKRFSEMDAATFERKRALAENALFHGRGGAFCSLRRHTLSTAGRG